MPNNEMDWEALARRLLSLMQRGVYLYSHSGHIWIRQDEDGDFDATLRRNNVSVNNKIYGGVLEALNVIDKALELCGQDKLRESWDEDWMFLGEDTLAENRIDVGKNYGGLY